MSKNNLNKTRVAIFLLLEIFVSILICLYLWNILDNLVYRVLTIFIGLIMVSNLSAKLLLSYFAHKT